MKNYGELKIQNIEYLAEMKRKGKAHNEKLIKETEPRVLNGEGSTNKITVMDSPGAGGACHRYLVTKDHVALCFVKFQEGPIKEFGVTGCQNEDLLFVVIDRLQCFQAGDWACDENEKALRKIEEGLAWLKYRTSDRNRRGVEGTNKR